MAAPIAMVRCCPHDSKKHLYWTTAQAACGSDVEERRPVRVDQGGFYATFPTEVWSCPTGAWIAYPKLIAVSRPDNLYSLDSK
jgi:hypothetical protein